jgi:hypothetical protein
LSASTFPLELAKYGALNEGDFIEQEQELRPKRLPSTQWSEIASASHNRLQKGQRALD